jgi:S-DNA-T family DNA segregation ATPase FtsK/SpoIIIE
VRVAQIKRLEEDIQLSLAAKGVRVVTLPGTNAIGIEVANEKPSTVSMLSVLDDEKFKAQSYDLPVALGMTITNDVMHFDLAKMPHLLVAGATGQGKSVGLNAILTSLLYYKHPSEMKLVLVDPKKVELSLYSKLEKHFLAQLPDADEPVITDTQKVVYTLKSLCMEMDSRYDLLKLAYVRNIKEYNEKFLSRKLNPLKGHRFLPYIVVVIDEFADLLMTAGKEIEEPIARLAQLARAIGIHLVIATQRPTTSVITGNIKANFPARIAFMVRSSVDSRTILDQTGANQLIGRGDMLISIGGELTRVQCAFIDTKEVERVVDFIADQRGYTTAHYLPEYTGEEKEDDGGVGEVDLNRRDSLFEDAAKLVVMHQQGSTSLIQRKMNLGYNRAGRIMDQLEAAGIVGPYEGSKARQVLVGDLSELDARLANIKDIYG